MGDRSEKREKKKNRGGRGEVSHLVDLHCGPSSKITPGLTCRFDKSSRVVCDREGGRRKEREIYTGNN